MKKGRYREALTESITGIRLGLVSSDYDSIVRTHPKEESQADKPGQATEPQSLEGWFKVEFRVGLVCRCASQPNHMASRLRPMKKVRSGYN